MRAPRPGTILLFFLSSSSCGLHLWGPQYIMHTDVLCSAHRYTGLEQMVSLVIEIEDLAQK